MVNRQAEVRRFFAMMQILLTKGNL